MSAELGTGCMTNVVEGISQRIEILAVGGDREIALDQGVKLGLKVDGPSLLVVTKNGFRGHP